MSKLFIINAHKAYPFAKGQLNNTLTEQAQTTLAALGHDTRVTRVEDGWDVDAEVENHRWADAILLQTPVNWMGVPWLFKQYMDEVYTAGMDGRLCDGDGRHRDQPHKHYGSGGTLTGKRYMLSLTFNAPAASFDDADQFLFQGRSADDLFFPMHMNFRFFGMTPLPTFACYDVMKNPQVPRDIERFQAHLRSAFAIDGP